MLLLSGMACLPLCAQQQGDSLVVNPVEERALPSNGWQSYLDDLSQTEDFEGISWQDYEDVLGEYAEHPMNINTADADELGQLPFLTAQQIEDIQAYLYQYGPMKSLGELAMITSMTWTQRKLLGYFVYAGEVRKRSFPRLADIAHYGKHEMVGMVQVPFYTRQGYRDGSYLGGKYKHWWRYQFRYADYVKLGFVASQDAGEPFFAHGNGAGFDYYSFYLQVCKLGALQNLTVGRYRLNFGMGLVMNSDFGFGKLASLSALGRVGNGIRVHSSRSEATYLQGMAATVRIAKNLDLTAFFSYRTIDATLRDGQIQTIVTTGLHRTEKEMSKKNVASEMVAGGHVAYRLKGFHLGATGYYETLSRVLAPNRNLLYKRYAPGGDRFWNASIDYAYVSHRLVIQGETATGDCGAVATINTASYQIDGKWAVMALQRFYPYRYYSLHANAFGEGSDVQDESGVYVGAQWNPTNRCILSAYTDVAYFAWPKFGTKESSHSWDNLLNLQYRFTPRWSLSARYRYKDKQHTQSHRGRLVLSYVGSQWLCTTRGELSRSQDAGKNADNGWMATQQVGYKRGWLRLNALMGYFHTDSYQSRIYTYEPGLLYAMNYACYFGHGIRYALQARADMGKRWVAIGKVGVTNYFDRNSIASGAQQIDKSSMADLEVQLKCRL